MSWGFSSIEEKRQALAKVRKERERLQRKVANTRKRKGICECLGQSEARQLHDYIMDVTDYEGWHDRDFIAQEQLFEAFVESIY